MPGLAPYKAKIAAGERVTVNARGTTVFLRQATGEIKVEVHSLAIGDSDGAIYTLRMEQAEEWLHARLVRHSQSLNVTATSMTDQWCMRLAAVARPQVQL